MIAVFPGTFDPITFGHVDLISRATALFDTVIVAVSNNQEKNSLLSHDIRIQLVKTSCKKLNVDVMGFDNLLINFMKEVDSKIIIRGVRDSIDFGFETTMANANQSLYRDLETVFIPSTPSLSHISSSLVREVLKYNGDVSNFVEDHVLAVL